MSSFMGRHRAECGSSILLGACLLATSASAQIYHPITPAMAGSTVVLTGNDLTIDQVIQVARYGSRVKLGAQAKQRNLDTFNLMNEGAAEGIAIYLFNRNSGAGREVVRFTGDPMSPANRPRLAAQALDEFRNGSDESDEHGPEFADEDVVRAMMLVRANQMTYLAASPAMLQALVDLINADITPVMRSRAGTGEAEGPAAGAMDAAMVGAGEVHYHGVRMAASAALSHAGLKPLQPAPGDNTMSSVNSDVAGLAAILVEDARRYLDWTDLAYSMDLNAMNSSITPLFMPVQISRPYPWINWDAARVLEFLKGSYLFDDDPGRIIQDPESLRASYVRQGSAWEEWGNLRDAVTIQMNGTEHNPVTRVNVSPEDSWELSTPQAMKYYVKGSAANGYKHGFVFSNANWDPYPLCNRLESFTIALANLDVAVMLRQERFASTFFTVVRAQDILHGGAVQAAPHGGPGWSNHEVWQTIQGLINPVPPEGYSADPEGVEELDAESLFKVKRAIEAVAESWMLVAGDLNTGVHWMDVRKAQDANRHFGAAPTAAWQALRRGGISPQAALAFIRSTPASTFYRDGPAMPGHAEANISAEVHW
ncbi:MAG TPA: aromatic amino acid ammonia-lyase [Steroidobacteraceae bacterium]|nr:aromatic amino acid ammonia-lyase [Steroidobacteraceae bacterium]